MAFHVDIPDAEQVFLDGLPLSVEAKERVHRFVEETVATIPDEFRLNPENRPVADAPYFVVQLLIQDIWGDGAFHTIDFYIRDDNAHFGVLLIVFIDHH